MRTLSKMSRNCLRPSEWAGTCLPWLSVCQKVNTTPPSIICPSNRILVPKAKLRSRSPSTTQSQQPPTKSLSITRSPLTIQTKTRSSIWSAIVRLGSCPPGTTRSSCWTSFKRKEAQSRFNRPNLCFNEWIVPTLALVISKICHK